MQWGFNKEGIIAVKKYTSVSKQWLVPTLIALHSIAPLRATATCRARHAVVVTMTASHACEIPSNTALGLQRYKAPRFAAAAKLTAWQVVQLTLTILGALSTLAVLLLLSFGLFVATGFGGGLFTLVPAVALLILAAGVVVGEVFWIRYLLRRWKRKNAAREGNMLHR